MYGAAPKYSYFNGCSTGGRQAINAVQRFPQDFNGVIAGAPVNPMTRLDMGSLYNTTFRNERAGKLHTALQVPHASSKGIGSV